MKNDPNAPIIIVEPKIIERKEITYVGIRQFIPSTHLSTWRVKLLKELNKWLDKNGIKGIGVPFQRFYLINMGTEFDFEIGMPVAPDVAVSVKSDDRVKPNVIPAGRYAALTYLGKNRAYQGNKTLVEWARDNGYKWDRWDDPKGDAFRSRVEFYLTDPVAQPNTQKWETEVMIKLADRH